MPGAQNPGQSGVDRFVVADADLVALAKPLQHALEPGERRVGIAPGDCGMRRRDRSQGLPRCRGPRSAIYPEKCRCPRDPDVRTGAAPVRGPLDARRRRTVTGPLLPGLCNTWCPRG